MVELAIRLLAASGLVLLAGMLGWESFDTVWKISAVICLYGFSAYALELKGKRNSGTAGIAACFDAASIAFLLASTGQLHQFGFLTLGPIAYAAARYGSLPTAMAPIAAFSVLGADQWAHQGATSDNATMALALGVLVIGLLLNHRRIVVTVAKPIFPEQSEPLSAEEPEAYMELRESFRKLKDMYHDLERKSRRDRHSADLRLVSSGDAVRFHRRLASQLQKLSGAEGLSLFTVSDFAGSMVVRAVEGSVQDATRQTVLRVTPGEAIHSIRKNTEAALTAFADNESGRAIRNVVLTHKGRMVGLVSLQGENATKIESAAEAIEELGPLVGEMIEENGSKRYFEGRLKRAELLYDVASASAGAASPNTLAARVVSQLSELWDVEHISICWIENGEALHAASHGQNMRLLDAMSFLSGPGVAGWLGVGAPEVMAFDVSDDVRCLKAEMGRQRIQSFALSPIGDTESLRGYLVVASSRSGAIDVPIVEGARMVAAELFQALLRMSSSSQDSSGLMVAGEFHRFVESAGEGCLVYLEPLRKEEAIGKFGQPALDSAVRQFAHRLRAKLPEGAAICRRIERDYVAFLPGFSESSARSWANEAAAIASLIGLPVDDNGKRVPLAIRAKVAFVGAEAAEMAESATG